MKQCSYCKKNLDGLFLVAVIDDRYRIYYCAEHGELMEKITEALKKDPTPWDRIDKNKK